MANNDFDDLEKRKAAAAAKEREQKEQSSLIFTGKQNPRKLAKIDKDHSDDLEISDAIWKAITNGEILKYIPQFLNPAEQQNLKSPKIKEKSEDLYEVLDGDNKLLEFSRNKGVLGLTAFTGDPNKDAVEPIRFMLACARTVVELEIDERLSKMFEKQAGDLSEEELNKQKQEARTKLLNEQPEILNFTIDTCAKAQDVTVMLTEMKKANPILTATLSDRMIQRVQQELDPLPGIIKEQIDMQQGKARAPSPKQG